MGRLFVAVWPPDPVLETLAALRRPAVPGVRWTEPAQWHVTLRFLGPVDDTAGVAEALRRMAEGPVEAAGVAEALRRMAEGPVEAAMGPVEAAMGPAVGRFGNRVLHVPVAGLDGLAERVVRVTAGLGRPPEDRPFAGHVTLARVAKRARVDLAGLAGEPVAGRWLVDEVCLVESHLAPTGARYEVLERFSP